MSAKHLRWNIFGIVTLFCLLITTAGSNAFASTRIQLNKQRICEQMEKRFGSNVKMSEKINKRIERRFGFRCVFAFQNQEEIVYTQSVDSVYAITANEIWIDFSEDIVPVIPIRYTNLTVRMRTSPIDTIGIMLPIAFVKHDASTKVYENVFKKKIVVSDADILKIHLAKPMQQCAELDVNINGVPFVDGNFFSGTYTVKGYQTSIEPPGPAEVESRSSEDPVYAQPGDKDVLALSLAIQVSCAEGIHLNQLQLSHEGTGQFSDIDQLSVLVHGKEGEEDRHFHLLAEDNLDVSFNPPVAFDPCDERIIDFLFDISANAKPGKTHQLSAVNATSAEYLLNIEKQNDLPSFCPTISEGLVIISSPNGSLIKVLPNQ